MAEFVATQTGDSPESVLDKIGLAEDRGLDSLETVELVMLIEEVFGIEMNDEDVDRLLQ